jgi:hypothetical protein
MGLYHFFWEGKERAVSINRPHKALVSLAFLDEDISKRISSYLLIEQTPSKLVYLNQNEIVSLEEAGKLLAIIKKAIGRPLNVWLPQQAE